MKFYREPIWNGTWDGSILSGYLPAPSSINLDSSHGSNGNGQIGTQPSKIIKPQMEDEHQKGRRMSKRANPSSSSASLPPQVAPTAVVSTARILVEFLEVAINSIVFLKGVYPSGAFERSRYINLVVQRAGHPELRDYIHTAVTALQPFIQKGEVESVALIFFAIDNIPVERFIFKLKVNLAYGLDVEESTLEFSLRSFLIKLQGCENFTKAFPADHRWEITAYFQSQPDVKGKEAELWIPTDTKQWQQPPAITPIKSMSSEPLCLQLYLEHSNLLRTPQ